MQSHTAYTSNMINVQAWGEAINECKIPNVQETKKHKTTQLLLFCFFLIIKQNSKLSLQPLPSSSDTVKLASAF